MKTVLKLTYVCVLLTGLTACQTIDEDRYANLACNDLKQLVTTDNLAALTQPKADGLYATSVERDSRQNRNLFSGLDNDKRRQAELRAAFRNNCD